MRRLTTWALVLAMLAAACSASPRASEPAPAARGPMGSRSEGALPLEQRRPGGPLQASVAFRRLLPDSVVLELLAEHQLQPYLAQVWGGGGGSYAQVPPDQAAPQVIREARRLLLERLERSDRCTVATRVRAFLQNDRAAESLPALEGSRALLSRISDEREALPRVRAGAPILWAVYVVGRPEDVVRLGAHPLVWVVEPARAAPEEGASFLGVTTLPEPEPVGRVEVRPDVSALSADEVRARLQALAAEGGPGCPPPGRLLPDGRSRPTPEAGRSPAGVVPGLASSFVTGYEAYLTEPR